MEKVAPNVLQNIALLQMAQNAIQYVGIKTAIHAVHLPNASPALKNGIWIKKRTSV